MAFEGFKWFRRRKEEEERSRALLLEEVQGLKKLLRKQSVMIEEVRRAQESFSAGQKRSNEPIFELCDSVFYMHRAFRGTGLVSGEHTRVFHMVLDKLRRFAASAGLDIIVDEGTPFDPRVHEAIDNRSPGAQSLIVLEVVSPGYLEGGNVLRPAKVVVGAVNDTPLVSEGISTL